MKLRKQAKRHAAAMRDAPSRGHDLKPMIPRWKALPPVMPPHGGMT